MTQKPTQGQPVASRLQVPYKLSQPTEMLLWEDRWVAITTELSEWDTLSDVNSQISNNILLAGTAAAAAANAATVATSATAAAGASGSKSNALMGNATGAGYSAIELALDLAIAKLDWATVREVCACCMLKVVCL